MHIPIWRIFWSKKSNYSHIKNEKQSSCKNNNIYTICDIFIELVSYLVLALIQTNLLTITNTNFASFCHPKPINNT